MSEHNAVLTERRGRVLVVTLNRPEARNAVNGDVAQGVEAAVDLLEDDDGIWAGVLTGNGPVFCAGADLKAVAAGNPAQMMTRRGDFAGFVRRERTKPVVAALNGPALAGGCEIALACDLVVASAGATIGIPEVKRSLLAMAGGLAHLPRAVGEKLALEMAMTGDPLPVQRLYEVGFVNRIVEPGRELEEAVALAGKICENAPLAVRASRQVVLAGRDLDGDARWRLAVEEMTPLYATEDFAEGPRAFIEKRKPEWKGR